MITGSCKIRAPGKVRLERPATARRLARAGRVAWALGALWVFAARGFPTPPPAAAPLNARAFTADRAESADPASNHHNDLVVIESKGRGPRGFRYRIVLHSATRGAESSLDITAGEGGLLVTARDVDGAGNDLDLIIKSAWSLTPVGVWINNHHGGFAKADASVYAPSIWSDGPFMLSSSPEEILHGALLPWHQSPLQPHAQSCPGERCARQGAVERTDFDMPSRRSSQPPPTRGPPFSFCAQV